EREARGRRPRSGNPGPPPRSTPSVRGVALLGLSGMALLDPPMRQALAQGMVAVPGLSPSSLPSFASDLSSWSPDLASQFSAPSTQVLAGFDQMEAACAMPYVPLLGLQPCVPGYQAGIVAQMQGLEAQAGSLLAP